MNFTRILSFAVAFLGSFSFLQLSPAACTYAISPSNRTHGYGAASNLVTVSTTSDCEWTVVNTNSWLTILVMGGTGSGTVPYSIAMNPSGQDRTGVVNIAGRPLTITQRGGPCTYTISPTSRNHGAGAESGAINLTTTSACSWNASVTSSWITILPGTNSIGPGTVNYSVAANLTGSARNGVITIAGLNFAVSQAAEAIPPAVVIGPVEVPSIGHVFFQRPNTNGLIPGVVQDFLIDQDHSSGGGAELPSLAVNWDTNSQFALTVSAPAGQKFMVHVPTGKAVGFSGYLIWESTRTGFSGAGAAQVSFGGLQGTPPEFFGATPVLSDSHGFWGFTDLQGGSISNDIAFTSITLTAAVLPQFTGNGSENYGPHPECALQFSYPTISTIDPGQFVSLVPVEQPLTIPPFVAVARESNGDVTLTFTGVLQSAAAIDDAFDDVPGNPQGNYTIQKGNLESKRFFRTRTP